MMMKSKIIGDYLDEMFPDPKCELNYESDYQLLLAIMLSAQTTDKRVNQCTSILFDKYKTLSDLKDAKIQDLEAIIRPLGSFHKKSEYPKKISTILVENYNGKVPVERDILEQFPGVGRKTVNVFFSEYYSLPAIAVDTHVDRVSKRLGFAKKDDSVKEVEEKLMKKIPKNLWAKRHLQLVLFGRYHCKAVKPMCSECKLKDICKEKKKDL